MVERQVAGFGSSPDVSSKININMNVTEISKHTVHYLETDEEDCNFFTRYSADNWSVRIGESDESVHDNETIAELEAAFQKWAVEKEMPDSENSIYPTIPLLSYDLLNWFDKNYSEPREECERLVIKGTIDYPFTPEQIKEKCSELKDTIIKNESLCNHIKLIGDLCNVGVSASIAGEKIREAILKMGK